MEKFKVFFVKSMKFYLVYIFIFAILLFAILKPKKIESTDIHPNNFDDLENTNKDRVALIESGKDAALVRLNLIEKANKNIDISYYTLIEGDSTELLLGSLLDAADRGIEVRILLDGLFHNLKGKLKNTIYGFELHPNIELKFYESFSPLSPWAWNNRLHDKIILVDEQLALIGGRNIGDKYFLEDIEKENFVKDRDVVIFKEDSSKNSPSVISDIRDYYNQIWNHEYSQPSASKITQRQKDMGKIFNHDLQSKYMKFKKQYLRDMEDIDWYKSTIPTEGIKFVHNPIGRVNQDPWCLKELLNLASQAEETIFVQSPYIIPSRNMKSQFSKYDIDLKNVNILTNSLSSSPNPLAISGYTNNKKEIVDNGVHLYEYQGPESLHGKTYIFDDYISVIGSFNLDARSSYINRESMVIISSKQFAHQLNENIKTDLNNSLKVNKDYSYIDDDHIEEVKVSIFTKTINVFLSKIVFFLEYLL